MSSINKNRNSCIDVFNSFLVVLATYAGVFEFPVINPCFEIPNALLLFSKCLSSQSRNYWVHFFEDDYLFERLWRNPKKYLPILKQYNGVILPDFSLYRDMPLVMQLWNIYRSRAIGCWLQANGIKVIPNVRFGDNRTYHCCCDGLSKHSVIAIGTHGTMKNSLDREIYIKGLDIVIKKLQPIAIVIYGSAPESVFSKYREQGIKLIQFESDFAIAMKQAKEAN